jgi:hypothetical protein
MWIKRELEKSPSPPARQRKERSTQDGWKVVASAHIGIDNGYHDAGMCERHRGESDTRMWNVISAIPNTHGLVVK